ncbi:MAG: globin domain-containing protein [Vicinamibacterales bacterium]
MTPDAIRRVQAHHQQVASETGALAAYFYEELFARVPGARGFFPADLTAQRAHFDASIALVIRNLANLDALVPSLRELGAQHLQWGAQPAHYPAARAALVAALRRMPGADWSEQLERDWTEAITAIVVPMLQGAAIETAAVAEAMAGPAREP